MNQVSINHVRRRHALLALAGTACAFAPAARAALSVLDEPSRPSRLATITPVTAVAAAGERLVAVGPRGHVLLSDSNEGGWMQVAVPTSADLTAVHFVSNHIGWAVGHGAVVMRTGDGGRSWVQQIDGRTLAKQMAAFYEQAVARGEEKAKEALAEAQRMLVEGPGRPLLSVWFRDEKLGFVVGAFNLILRTQDGGESWQPWSHRTDNPRMNHLNVVTGDATQAYVVGEQGLLLRLADDGERFVAMNSPYNGTYFGALVPEPGALLVFGLRGNVFGSHDQGASWSKVETGDPGGVTGGALLTRGQAAIVTQSGRVLRVQVGQSQGVPLNVGQAMPYAGIAVTASGRVGLVGLGGVQTATMGGKGK